MAFAFIVWWWYFDGAEGSVERHIKTKKQAVRFRLWNYAHLPLFLGIGVAGVGFEHTIALQSDERLHRGQGWILCSAVAVLMAALIVIGGSSERAQKRGGVLVQVLLQCAILAAVVVLGVFAGHFHRVALVIAVLLGCVGQTILAQRGMAPRLAIAALVR